MTHLLAFALCLAGFVALACAIQRQHRDLFKSPLSRTTKYVLRTVGTCFLLLALAVLVGWRGWSLGLVMFSGHTSIAAGFVFCILAAYAGRRTLTSNNSNLLRRRADP